LIHPAQIEPANEIFAPSAAEVAWAQQITAAFDAAPRGVIMVEGRMVDTPIVRQAQRVLERAARAGRLG
jgi:citrate lyase subunit beta/citryl-CoA lyase